MKGSQIFMMLVVVALAIALLVSTTNRNKQTNETDPLTEGGSVVTAAIGNVEVPSAETDAKADINSAQSGRMLSAFGSIIDMVAAENAPQTVKELNPLAKAKAQMQPVIDPQRPVIALTFDDGPSEYTEQILDILTQNGARATFFVVGNRIAGRENILENIYLQGSEIANHSWNHADLAKMRTEKEVVANLQKTIDAVAAVINQEPTLMRPPYGAVDAEVIDACITLGLPIINWNIDTLDWQSRDAKQVYDIIMRQTYDGSIILLHDLYESTALAMQTVIPELVAQGYQLVTVTELIEHYGERVPGNIYRRVQKN